MYENLVYSCGSCNWTKSTAAPPDPCVMAYGGFYRFEIDGTVTAINKQGELYIEYLGLDLPHLERFRKGKFRTFLRLQELLDVIGDDIDELDAQDAIEEIEDLLGYPPEMPDLRRKKAQAHDETRQRATMLFCPARSPRNSRHILNRRV